MCILSYNILFIHNIHNTLNISYDVYYMSYTKYVFSLIRCLSLSLPTPFRSAYVRQVYATCSRTFWDFFLPLHELPTGSIDSAIQAARNAFHISVDRDEPFPKSMRALRYTISKVTSSYTCCVPSSYIMYCYTLMDRFHLSGLWLRARKLYA